MKTDTTEFTPSFSSVILTFKGHPVLLYMRTLLLCLLPVALMGNYLVKVEGFSNHTLFNLNDQGIFPIDRFENSVLVLCEDPGILYLSTKGYVYEVLDEDPIPDHYYMALCSNENTLTEFSSNITILSKGSKEWLLRLSTLDDLIELNRHQMELKHLNFLPLIQPGSGSMFYTQSRDTMIQQMVDEVDYDTIIGNVRSLQNFQTRYSTTDSARACADWLMNTLISYGYDSVYLDTFLTNYAPNVVAIKWGMVHPSNHYVVGCGHFDCTSQIPTVFAPGADDNASGTATVIEMARVLCDYLFEYTIYLIAFCGEEQGLIGSEHFAHQASVNNDTIIGVINLDMFAYTIADRDTFTIINDTTYMHNLWLANMFSACADTYTTLKKKVWTGRRPYSDHASFGMYGFQAIHGRENINVSNPYYHTTGDSIGGGYNADTMVFKGIKASLATLATLAIPYEQTAITEKEYQRSYLPGELEVMPTIQAPGKIVRITGYFPGAERVTVSLHSVTGQCISERTLATYDEGCVTWDIHCHMPAGVYFVQARTNMSVQQQKIIICH